MKPVRFITFMLLSFLISSCRQEETPDPYTSFGNPRPTFYPIDWTGVEYLLYQAADSTIGDSSFVTYPTQDTLFFLTDTSMRFRGDTMNYQVFRTVTTNSLVFRMILTPYGHFQYVGSPYYPDSIHVYTGNNPWFHQLWMVRL